MSTVTDLPIEGLVIEETPPLTQPLGDWDGPIPDPDKVPDAPESIEEAQEPPRRGRPRRAGTEATEPLSAPEASSTNPLLTATGKVRKGALVKPLTKMYMTLGAGLMLADPVCGQMIVTQAPKCAEALDELAQQKPEIGRALVALLETSAWSAVFIAHMPIILAILSHHVPAYRNFMQARFSSVLEMMNEDGDSATS